MFKWIVLIVVIVAASGFGWMMYDVTRDLKDTAAALREAAADVKEASRTTQEVSQEMLPISKSMYDMARTMQQGKAGMEAMAQAAQFFNPMRKLAGGATQPAASQPAASQPAASQPAASQPQTGQPQTGQPQTVLSDYADAVLESIGNSGGEISTPIPFSPTLSADDWVTIVRPQAMAFVIASRNETDFINALSGVYNIQVGDDEPIPLKQWILANHPPAKESN